MRFTEFLLLSALFVFYGTKVSAETVTLKDSRDTWLSGVSKEVDYNMGAADRLKLKTWQESSLIDFDVSPVKGKKIVRAWLHLHPVGKAKFGLNHGTDLRWLSLSTVSHDWVEGKARSYARDTDGHGATFNESSFQRKNWGWDGARVWDVILGNGNTLRHNGQLVPAENGYLRIELDPRLVQALAAGASYGIFVMDGNTTLLNNFVGSRESKNPPFLVVELAGDDKTPPPAPREVSARPEPDWATPEYGALHVSLSAPEGALTYNITLDGRPVPRWNIPFAGKAGSRQEFRVLDLPPDKDMVLEVSAVDGAGNVSAPVRVQARSSARLTVPQLPPYPFNPKGGPPKKLGDSATVWAFAEITKVDPVSAEVIHEKAPADFKRRNAVWDGAVGTVRLAAARSEIISFQVAVEGRAKGCGITVSNLAGPGGVSVSSQNVKLWRNWYVGRESEYAIPLKQGEKFDCPSADNNVKGQKLQAVTVDYFIPKTTPAGDYTGTVTVSSAGGSVKLELKVKVYDVTIPDEIFFNPELNCYGGPGEAGSEQFKNSFRLAHYNRCTINRVPYSQTGRVDKDWSPDVDSKGHVTDWSRFDNDLGGLLDGSWFKGNPRDRVPVPTLYLPFFDGWPLNFRDYYNPGKGISMKTKNRDNLLKLYTLAKPVDEAMSEDYKKAWKRCLSEFYAHFKEKGWNRTIFECYLNNKPKYGYSIWTLDEPTKYLDWAALNFFAGMWKEAINDPSVYEKDFHVRRWTDGLAKMNRDKPVFLFRGDISRMAWQGSVSDGLMTIIYLGGSGLRYPRLIRNAKERMPSVMNAYGSCNDVNQSNWQSTAWCLKVFSYNEDGVLPWQSLGKEDSLFKPNKLGLIIDTKKRFGGPVASFRVHALRRGAQDCELMRLLQLKNGWSREHLGLLASQKVPMTAEYKQKFADEAATMSFGSMTAQGFCELKEGILQLLTAANASPSVASTTARSGTEKPGAEVETAAAAAGRAEAEIRKPSAGEGAEAQNPPAGETAPQKAVKKRSILVWLVPVIALAGIVLIALSRSGGSKKPSRR